MEDYIYDNILIQNLNFEKVSICSESYLNLQPDEQKFNSSENSPLNYIYTFFEIRREGVH